MGSGKGPVLAIGDGSLRWDVAVPCKETLSALRIARLHTAESNVAVFDAALRQLGLAGVELRHSMRADLLAAAERAGRLTPDIAAQTAEALRELCDGADAVLLTCSILGPAAETAMATTPIPVMRVDAATLVAAGQQPLNSPMAGLAAAITAAS